jgi:hypothetical protein
MQPHPRSEAEAQAISKAQDFAEAHPDEIGYPWLDPETGAIQLSAASQDGRALLNDVRASFVDADAKADISIRDAAFSLSQLNAISDDVTTLHAQGVPDADLIYASGPDFKANRIIIRVSSTSTKLFAELARRYGTEAIGVWIEPNGGGGSTLSRDADVSPFWGGAGIGVPVGGCSDSYSWIIGSTSGNALLTAAHCAPAGGNVTIGTSSTVRGTVKISSEENWSNSVGTQYYSGQSTYRGDVALIRLKSGVTSNPIIYRGGPTSSNASWVGSKLGRRSYTGENFFVGGARTGETGPYHINFVQMNWWYSENGPNVWVRNVTIGYILFSTNPVVDHGDSGGSVFRLDTSGNVIALGTLSGRAGDSSAVFTELYDSWLALPGDLNY